MLKVRAVASVASVGPPSKSPSFADTPQFIEDGVRYAANCTYDVKLTDGRLMRVFWNANLFGDALNVNALTNGPCVLGVVNAFGNHELIVRSEPTMDNRLGVTVCNRNGKALLLGMGDIFQDGQDAYLIAEGRETFQWRKASPSSCGHTNYTVKNGGGTHPQ
jgi:hypothetical protein